MRVLHYINSLEQGGAETILVELLSRLEDYGVEVELLLGHTGGIVSKLQAKLEDANIKVHSLNSNRYNPWQIIKLRNFLKKNQFDLIHTHLFATDYWAVFYKRFFDPNQIIVHTEHGSTNNKRNYNFFKPIERYIYKHTDLSIAISPKVEENLVDWLAPTKIETEVISNGVNTEGLRQAKPDPSSYPFWDQNKRYLLMVASFRNDGSKDHKVLIDSLNFLPDDVHILFAGDGSYRSEIENYAASQGHESRVIFLGLRSDIHQLMNLADLNILASNNEGVSGVALEAMASSKPFIGSRVEGIKDIVPSDAFLFAAKDAEDTAQKIHQVLSDKNLGETMVRDANKHVEKYSIDKMVSNYANLYKKLHTS